MVFSKICKTLLKQRKFRYKNPKKAKLSKKKKKSFKQLRKIGRKRSRKLRKLNFKFNYNTKQLLNVLYKLKENTSKIHQIKQKNSLKYLRRIKQKEYKPTAQFNYYIVKKYEKNFISLPKSRFSLKKQQMRRRFFKNRRRRIIAKITKRIKKFRRFKRYKKYKKKPTKFKTRFFKLKLKYKFRKNRKKRALNLKRRIAIVN